MPRIALIDPEGCLVNFPRAMMEEGADVLYHSHPSEAKTVGANIVPCAATLGEVLAWCKEKPSIAFFLGSGMGKASPSNDPAKRVTIGADEFRRAGITVVGAGSFCDRLEHDRLFGEQIAREIGCTLPETKSFQTVSDALSYVEAHGEDSFYFKSDRYLNSDATCGGSGETMVRSLKRIRAAYGDRIKNILQEKIEGVPISTAAWWNGHAFLRPFEGTIEHKKAYNGDLGPATGCAFNLVWFYREDLPEIVSQQGWDKLEAIFAKNEAPPGIYDINAIAADDGTAYFLEWTPRLGVDSEPTSFRLWSRPTSDVIERLAKGRLAEMPVRNELAYSVRLGVPPYPFEGFKDDKGSALGVGINGEDGLGDGFYIPYAVRANEDGELEVADRLGLVGLSLDTGTSLERLHERVLDYAKSMTVQGLGYRTDGLDAIRKDIRQMRRAGFDVPDGI